MYPVYLNAAEFQQEAGAKRSFHFALEAEKQHETLQNIQRAKDAGNLLFCHKTAALSCEMPKFRMVEKMALINT